jgi:4-amino-4-deoxy-L-arabinose transferase-like glycosyltransferase
MAEAQGGGGRGASLAANARSLLLLLLLSTALLVPFLGKPLHLDDPMYVWTAERIAQHPGDFYGLDVNWCYTREPMARANDNPPLVSYALAAAGALLGWSEPALHGAMLGAALLAVAGVWVLARRLGAPPFLAGLGLLAMPGFLVSSTTLMADVLATALWTWAVVAWVRGLQEEATGWLLTGALLAGLCLLTKFVGLALLPLLFAYAALKYRRLDRRMLLLAVPLGVALLYRARMLARYGVDPFRAVGSFALEMRQASKASAFELPWLGLGYLGGTCLPALLLAGWIFRRRGWAACAVLFVAVGAGLLLVGSFSGVEFRSAEGTRLNLLLHLSAFMTGGAIVLALAWQHVARTRSAEAILLGLWIGGIFLFASFFNWSTNVRSILPATPAVAIMLASELQRQDRARGQLIPLALLGLSMLAGLLVAQGDLAYAQSARKAAIALTQEHGPGGRPLWFEGSWGFQYYMERGGASKINWDSFQVLAGDPIVRPSSNACRGIKLSPYMAHADRKATFPLHAVASTVTGGAGFYSHLLGVVPYLFGTPLDEVYSVYHIPVNFYDLHPAVPFKR